MSSTQILSVVAGFPSGTETADIVDRLDLLRKSLARAPFACETVLILNGCADHVVGAIRQRVRSIPDAQAYVLSYPVDELTAVLAGLENALGDWVATIDIVRDPPELLERLFQEATENNKDVVWAKPSKEHSSVLDRLGSWVFHWIFRKLHGFNLSLESVTPRILSRRVVNTILRHEYPLVALFVLPATGGFARASVTTDQLGRTRSALRDRVRHRMKVLLGINAAPLRAAHTVCGIGAGLACVYSVYVGAIYWFKEDVMPGWTTVSLLLSAMFLSLSVVLWLLTEFLVLSLNPAARRPDYEIFEEFGSNTVTLRGRLNVETEL